MAWILLAARIAPSLWQMRTWWPWRKASWMECRPSWVASWRSRATWCWPRSCSPFWRLLSEGCEGDVEYGQYRGMKKPPCVSDKFDMFWWYSVRERLDVGQLQSLWTGGHPSCSAKGGERIFKFLAPCCWKPHEQATEFRWDQMISNADALCSREFFLRYACKCRRRPTDSVDYEFKTEQI